MPYSARLVFIFNFVALFAVDCQNISRTALITYLERFLVLLYTNLFPYVLTKRLTLAFGKEKSNHVNRLF